MKKILSLLTVILIFGAWGSLFYRNSKLPKEYSSALENAKKACTDGFYLEAQDLLDKANELQGVSPAYESDAIQRDIYFGMNSPKYEKQLIRMIENYPENEENYEKIVCYYSENENYRSLAACIDKYYEKWPDNAVIKKIDDEFSCVIRYRETGYFDVKYINDQYIDIRRVEKEYSEEVEEIDETERGDAGETNVTYAEVVSRSILSYDGEEQITGDVVEASISEDGKSFFVLNNEGKWQLMDSNHNLLAKNDDVAFDSIGRLGSNGIATAVIDGKIHYINKKMKVNNQVWDDCTDFSEGYAGICKGGSWAIVDTDSLFSEMEFPYADVVRNESNYCVVDGKAVVSDSTGYFILDVKDMKPSFDTRFEELGAINSSQPIAYRQGQKWGFIFHSGNVYAEPKYDCARSYINGYAAIQMNGLWGIVDRYGRVVIEPQFSELTNVFPNGLVYVRNDAGFWDQIIIEKKSNQR